MTAIGIGWGITWFAYASDYSRFVSLDVPRRKLYLGSVLGQFLPTVWLGVFGATLATITTATDPGKIVVDAFGALAIPVILLVIHGPIATNVLNIYSCALCAQTLDWKVERRTLSYGVGVLATLFTIYLILHGSFAENVDGWLAGLVTWVAPWGAIMLVHYYAVAKQKIDVHRCSTAARAGSRTSCGGRSSPCGRHGRHLDRRVRRADLAPGPAGEELGGIDLSWLAGSIVAGVVYVALRPRRTSAGTAAAADAAPQPRRIGAGVIDLLVRNARLLASGAGAPLDSPDGDTPLVDVHVDQGRFLALPPSGTVAVEARTVVDAAGALVTPPYVEPHVHLDAVLTAGQPRGTPAARCWRASRAGPSASRC